MATTHPPLGPAVLHGLGGRLFLALWGGLALVLVTRALGFTTWLITAVVVALVGACSLGLRVAAALVVAGVGWLVVDGFVSHRYGQLGFDGQLLLVLVAAISLALTVSTITRKVHR
jgi:hypothetical protein